MLINEIQVVLLPEISRVLRPIHNCAVSYVDMLCGNIQVEEVENTDGLSPTNVSASYTVQLPSSPINPCEEVIPTPPLPSEQLRFSKRNLMMSGMNMMDRAAALSKKRNLEGTSSPVTHKNSFDVLFDPELMIRARKMGAAIPDTDFTAIDVIRELEISRRHEEQICCPVPAVVNDTMFLTNELGESTPVSDKWGDENDSDKDDEHVDEDKIFSKGKSGKKKSGKKKVNIVARPVTRSQAGKGGVLFISETTAHSPCGVTKNKRKNKKRNK